MSGAALFIERPGTRLRQRISRRAISLGRQSTSTVVQNNGEFKQVSIGMVGIKGEWWMPRLEKAMKDVA
jgi:hypothetical protein